MTHQRYLTIGSLFLALLIGMAAARADDSKLCDPFRNSKVDQAVVTTMLSAAEDGKLYRIRADASNFGFCVKSAIGPIDGEFTQFQGGMSLQSKDQEETGPAIVRIDTQSLKTNGLLVKHILKGDAFFDVKNFPEVLFVSKSVKWLSPTEGVLTGDLTLRGITRSVDFRLELVDSAVTTLDNADKIQLKASTTIRRSDFGMTALPSLAEDAVDLHMQVEAVRYSG
jgi:polyisoprenoid-binding protein YceI